jgi:hypothetical protein
MAFGVAGTKDCKVPTTTAKAKRQITVLEPLMRDYRRARDLTNLLPGIPNLGVPTESYKNPKKICIWAGGFSSVGWQIRPTSTVRSKIFFKVDVHFARVGPCKKISYMCIQIKQTGIPSDPIKTNPIPSVGSNPSPSRATFQSLIKTSPCISSTS